MARRENGTLHEFHKRGKFAVPEFPLILGNSVFQVFFRGHACILSILQQRGCGFGTPELMLCHVPALLIADRDAALLRLGKDALKRRNRNLCIAVAARIAADGIAAELPVDRVGPDDRDLFHIR